MSGLQPIFSGALQRMQEERSDLWLMRPTESIQKELERLAAFAVIVTDSEGAITAKSLVEGGYVLTSESASPEKLRGVAAVLANLSNYPVSYLSPSGETQSAYPLGVPVLNGDTTSQLGARRGVARAIFDALKRGCDDGAEVKKRLSVTDAQQTKLSEHCVFKVANRQSGLRELVIESDISILSHEPFLASIAHLQKSYAPFILRFAPSFASTCSRAHELFGNHAAWKLERNNQSYLLSIVSTPEIQGDFITKAARCLEARANVPITVKYVSPECLRLLPPNTSTKGVSPSCTPTTYLPCSIVAPKSNSNIAVCEIPFAECHERVLSFISEHIATGSAFVRVLPQKNPKLIAAKDFPRAMSDLTKRLAIPPAEVSTVESANNEPELIIKLPPVTAVTNHETLALGFSYIDAMRKLCTTPVRLPRHASRMELFTFFSQAIGHECDWDFVNHDGRTVIQTRTPERFSDTVLNLAKTIFGRSLLPDRQPEEERGEFLLSPREVHAHPDTRQFFPGELEHIFPRGFGHPPIVVQEGNRLLVYSMTRNLPRAYINAVTPDLYGISVPVLLRTDMRATLVHDANTLRDIVVRSLPSGTYLRGITDEPQTFTLELSRVAGEHSDIEEVLDQIKACCSKQVAISWISPTPELRSVISRLSTEIERRFFALTIDSSNVVAETSTLTRTFLELFGCEYEIRRKPLTNVTPYSHLIRDLTSLDCYPVDKENTRISEDAFSVEPLPDGGYRFGIHIIAGSQLVPFGSPADILARKVGESCNVELEGHEYPFRPFSKPVRELFNLASAGGSPSFTLTFETDSNYAIKPDSYDLFLARVKSHDPISFEQADSALESAAPENASKFEASLLHVEKLIETQDRRSSSFSASRAQYKSKQLTHRLLMMFSDYAHRRLTEAGIPLPPATLHGSEMDLVKFTSPVRNATSLLAQRQLERFIFKQPALSDSMIEDHVARIGVSAEDTRAYRLILAALQLRESHPSQAVILLIDGEIRAGESL